ncbi:hypothetical protein DJ88_4422 [Bacillus paralicheniformis]|nr:hypothetical protein DJ88_4422 [Bacillus paralicheniformis]
MGFRRAVMIMQVDAVPLEQCLKNMRDRQLLPRSDDMLHTVWKVVRIVFLIKKHLHKSRREKDDFCSLCIDQQKQLSWVALD